MSRFYDDNNTDRKKKKIGHIYDEDVFTPEGFSEDDFHNLKKKKNSSDERASFKSDFTGASGNGRSSSTKQGNGYDFLSDNAPRKKTESDSIDLPFPELSKKNGGYGKSDSTRERNSDYSFTDRPHRSTYEADYGQRKSTDSSVKYGSQSYLYDKDGDFYKYKPLLSYEDAEKEVFGESGKKTVDYSDGDDYERKPPKNSNTKKKKSGFKRVFSLLLAVIIILSTFFGVLLWNKLGKVNSLPDSHASNKYVSDSELMKSKDIYNILILGTDKRQGDRTFRSDTMMLVSINKKNKSVKLTSFLRDTYVYIPAKKIKARLNAACSYGGAQMVIDTIEYNYKIKIDSYVMLTFNAFRSVINGLGGVTLDISEKEAAAIKKDSNGKYSPKPGVQNCDGYLALWYARIRKLDSDVFRTSRQREVIEAVAKKALKTNPVKLLNMLDGVLPGITTDMLRRDIVKAGLWVLPCLSNGIEGKSIPDSGTWHDDKYYNIICDFSANIKILKSFIYGG